MRSLSSRFFPHFFPRLPSGFLLRMLPRLLLPVLLLAVVFLAVGDYAGSGSRSGGLLADQPSPECIEFYTDYSENLEDEENGCRGDSNTCGTYCFFANCIKCSDECHEHCRTECSEDCDADGNCSETCWEVCWTERHGVSPCDHWLWHLYGKDPMANQWKNMSHKPYGDCDVGSHSRADEEPPLDPHKYYSKHFDVPTPRDQPPLGLLGEPPFRNKCFGDDPPTDPTPQPMLPVYSAHPGPVYNPLLGAIHAGETPGPNLEGVWITSPPEGAFFIGGMDVRRFTDIDDLGLDTDRYLSVTRAPGMLPEVSDPGPLAVIPGETGAPVLQSVSRVLEPPYNVAILSVGSHSGALEYRIWRYNGTVPDENRPPDPSDLPGVARLPDENDAPDENWVPFRSLPADGRVVLPRSMSRVAPSPPSPFTGVYSFQVRDATTGPGPARAPGSYCPPHRLFATPVPASTPLPTLAPLPSDCQARSNVVHQIFGPPSLPTPPVPRSLPGQSASPVRTPHPLPTLEFGSRPAAPSIVSASEVPGTKGDVRVVVASGHSGGLEYRAWTHTGRQPDREDELFVLPGEDDDEWLPAGSPNFVVPELDYPLFWSFQVRAVDGGGVQSEPSGTVSVMVWGGAGSVHSNLRDRISGMMEIPDMGQPLPAPASGTRPDPPDIQAVDEVIGMPGKVLVTMRSHSGALQLRFWRHTGRLPAPVYERSALVRAGRLPDGPEYKGKAWSWTGVSPDASGRFTVTLPDYPTMWDFQTRTMSGGLESEPSNVISLMVWGEVSPSPTPCAVWEHDRLGQVPCVALPPPSTPTPVPTATPVPTPTPAPVCIRDMGVISGEDPVYRGDTWIGGCGSVNFPGRHAVYYTFSLPSETEVRIDLESAMDNIVYLLSGSGDSGSVLHVDDNGGQGHNARLLATLAAGEYTVEAVSVGVSVGVGEFGQFVLSVTPSSAITCLEGNAVSGSDVPWNPGLAADCEALLISRDVLARSASLDWSAARPIHRWVGVSITGSLSCHAADVRVMCEHPARVTSVSLVSGGLTGIVPSALGDLSALRSLILDHNSLTGSLPPSLGGLSSLHTLSLSDNRITGPVPSSLGGLSVLRRLYLDENALSGPIPSSLGGLAGLELLDLGGNLLTGPVPPSLGNLAVLRGLWLDHNSLSGALPGGLGDLSALRTMDLRENHLSGQIPAGLGRLGSLEKLWLSHNSLTGPIPAELGDVPFLVDIYLQGNGFTGCIPNEIEGVVRNDFGLLGIPFCGGT